MSHAFRAVRRPVLATVVGAVVALLAVGTSALAVARAHHHGKHSGATRQHGASKARHLAPTTKQGSGGATITSVDWGSVDGQPVDLFTLRNADNMIVKITNYGGVVQSIRVPGRDGKRRNVVLGFPTLSDYVNDFTQGATGTPWPLPGGSNDTFFGAIIGRYANRIADHSFDLNGTHYTLDANNGGVNTLHGGFLGWNTKVWNATTSTGNGSATLRLTLLLPAGEGCLTPPSCTGFPAPIMASVTYKLTPNNQLKIDYRAKNRSPNLATVINLTNHSYFNLAGEGSGDVYNQLLAMNSDKYTPVNTNLIPESPFFVPVNGTAFDFRSMHPIGEFIRRADLPDGTAGPFKQLVIAHGYDHNWVLNGSGYRLVSVAQNPNNGITLWTYTTEPGVQMYSGNFLVGDLVGPSGRTYRQGDGFTLETQHYPDSPHHIGDPAWPSVVLNPGSTFTSTTSYKFGVTGRGLKNQIHFP